MKRLEVISNLAIVALAILAGTVLIKNHFLAAPAIQATPEVIKAGDRVAVDGLSWTSGNGNVILALQADCRYCTESAPFYRDLIRELNGAGVSLAAIFPDSASAGQAYLERLNLAVPVVRTGDFMRLKIRGTPTLMFVDNQGVVQNVWIGKLSPAQQTDVFETARELLSGPDRS